MKPRQIVVLIVLAIFVGFWFYANATWNVSDKLTIEFLKESRADLAELYAERPLVVISIYMLVYIVVTALSLPGAVPLSLAGGATFGLAVGVLTISFASTIGASLAFVFARTLLRDWVQSKWSDTLKTVNKGIEKEGAFYLFSLRLVPAFPFFLINILMGLTPLRLRTFYWVSQVGMLAGTIVYVYAGTELGKISSFKGILSPKLLVAFTILGLFPLVAKKLLGWLRERRNLNSG